MTNATATAATKTSGSTTTAKKRQPQRNVYRPEKFKPNETTMCRKNGAVRVVGKNDHGWAIGVRIDRGGRPGIIITNVLTKLIQSETTAKIAELTGVSPTTAKGWKLFFKNTTTITPATSSYNPETAQSGSMAAGG